MTTLPHAPGAQLLGTPARSTDELIAVLQEGMPVRVIERLATAARLPHTDVLRLIGLSSRTYARRQQEGRLTSEESERAARLARVIERAHQSFGPERGNTWLRTAWPALGHHDPLHYARTDLGAQVVLELIAALEEGIFV